MSSHQTYSNGSMTWKVKDLWDASKGLMTYTVAIRKLPGQDQAVWGRVTPHSFLDHLRRVLDADLSYPIIVTPEGDVADGHHRIVKARHLGLEMILAVQLKTMPLTGWVEDPLEKAKVRWKDRAPKEAEAFRSLPQSESDDEPLSE